MPTAPPPQPAVPGAPLRPDEVGPPPAVGLPTGDPARVGDADATLASRRCGRCLAMFPGDPDLDPVALPEWWLCPPCRLALLGRRPGGPATPVGAHHGR